MNNTGPESTVPPAAPGDGGADAAEGRELTFEAAQKELEAIVEKLERGEAELEQLTALSMRGEELYRFCREKLDAAHGKIEELAKPEA